MTDLVKLSPPGVYKKYHDNGDGITHSEVVYIEDSPINDAIDNGNLKTVEQYRPAYEDNYAGVAKVESRYNYTRLVADYSVKAGTGLLHSLTFACADSTPTAGSIVVYDSLTEAGDIIYSETFDTTPFRGFSVILDVVFTNGLYIGFTTTADIGVTASWR
jgi:hypothetical protein